MADFPDKSTEHLFLDKDAVNTNSFIANINLLSKNLEHVKYLNTHLTDELIKAIDKIGSVELKTLTEDLLKGSANGERQLGINLINNIMGIEKETNPVDASAIWNDPTAIVSYNKAVFTFIDGTKFELLFSVDESPINIKTNILSILSRI